MERTKFCKELQFISVPDLPRARAMTMMGALILCALFARGAFAACGSSAQHMRATAVSTPPLPALQESAPSDVLSEQSEDEHEPAIAGLWKTVFVSGGAVVNLGFNTWHHDGTEWALDGSFPPSRGNVCPGVWEKVGRRTYVTVHPAFNYDASGVNITSIFIERLKVTISRDGNSFEGTFRWDNYDFEGNLLSGSVTGTVTATRIKVCSPFPFPFPR
jgi:hypothetical protein